MIASLLPQLERGPAQRRGQIQERKKEIQNSMFKFQQALPNSRTTTNKTHSQHLVRGEEVAGVAAVVDMATAEAHKGVTRR